MTRSRLLLVLGVTVPAILCALVGLTHPMSLMPTTAEYWQNMHIVLLPLFPLIGLAPWLVARRVERPLGWVAALLGYGFAIFYGALDVLAGIGGGAMVLGGEGGATSPLFTIARTLAHVGVYSLMLAGLVAGYSALRAARNSKGLMLLALIGTVPAVVGAYLVYQGHIYFPVGTIAMILIAIGYGVLAIVVSRSTTAVTVVSSPPPVARVS